MNAPIVRRRACGVALSALVVLAVACAEKTLAPSVALSPRFTINVTAMAARTAAPQKLLVAAAYLAPPLPGDDPSDTAHFLDFAALDVTGVSQQVNLKIDLTTCLADPTRRGSRDACTMYIIGFLEPPGFDPDSSGFFGPSYDVEVLGPFDVTPGHPPTPGTLDLSVSHFAVNHWEADESLRLGDALTPEGFTGPITGAVNGTGAPTLFAVTQGQAPTAKVDSTFFGSVLAVYQDGSWRRVSGAPANSSFVPFFTGVAAFSPTDAYLSSVGVGGLFHFDGTAIRQVGGVQQGLRSVAVSSATPNARYVIAGTDNNGGVWVGNGTTFTRYSLPALGSVDLVCINSGTEAFATSRASGVPVYRFDGANWAAVQTPNSFGIADLQCSGPGQIYLAAGGTLYRWNGNGWTSLVGPPPGTNGRPLHWAVVSPNEIYAAGDSAGVNRAFYRFDGTSWREVGRLAYTTAFSSIRLWADPRGGAAYVAASVNDTIPARIDIVTPTSAKVLVYEPALRDVAMPTPSSAFVVGLNFFLARWNGARWTVDAPPAGTATIRALRGVWADGPGNAWAVGSRSTIVRWDGTRWNLLSDSARAIVFPSDNYNAVWGTGGSVWIVGDASIVRCSAPSTCATNPQPGAGALYGVWGTSATNVFAVGAGGRILHFDGSSWSSMTSPTGARLSRVSGSGPNDVWAAGDTVLLHFDGSAWKSSSVAGPASSVGYRSSFHFETGLWAASAREVYYGAWSGRILRGGGPDWGENPLAVQGSVRLLSIAGAPGGCALAVADPPYSSATDLPNLLRGVGPTGCLSTPMSPPASWP